MESILIRPETDKIFGGAQIAKLGSDMAKAQIDWSKENCQDSRNIVLSVVYEPPEGQLYNRVKEDEERTLISSCSIDLTFPSTTYQIRQTLLDGALMTVVEYALDLYQENDSDEKVVFMYRDLTPVVIAAREEKEREEWTNLLSSEEFSCIKRGMDLWSPLHSTVAYRENFKTELIKQGVAEEEDRRMTADEVAHFHTAGLLAIRNLESDRDVPSQKALYDLIMGKDITAKPFEYEATILDPRDFIGSIQDKGVFITITFKSPEEAERPEVQFRTPGCFSVRPEDMN